MKSKNIVLALLSAGVLTFSSCSSFLDETPKANIGLADYYKNQAQAQESINSG